MTRYEYKREFRGKVAGVQAYSSPDVGYLNEQGKQGWMLCGLYESTPGFECYVFKREKRRKVMDKRYLWVVEIFGDENQEWGPDHWTFASRKEAREEADFLNVQIHNKTRVRKYVPAE